MEPDFGRIFTSFDIQSWCRSNAISIEAISWIEISISKWQLRRRCDKSCGGSLLKDDLLNWKEQPKRVNRETGTDPTLMQTANPLKYIEIFFNNPLKSFWNLYLESIEIFMPRNFIVLPAAKCVTILNWMLFNVKKSASKYPPIRTQSRIWIF